LVNPSGWAFAIWGPIYLGEAAFVAAQLLAGDGTALANALPNVTAPFVAANLVQSLWCASFRPSYSEGWSKWISAFMLGGTAYSLSFVHAAGLAENAVGWYWFLPMTVHFGWTTAATLVNLNGSFAMQESTSDRTIVAVGHASALTAAALGVGVTLGQASPAYGLTVAWALAACADGMSKRLAESTSQQNRSESLKTGASIQRLLCWAGSAACVGASIMTFLM
jgi:predicted branched-subunit amino acid permease